MNENICPKCGKPMSEHDGSVGAARINAATATAQRMSRQQAGMGQINIGSNWDAVVKQDRSLIFAPINGDINFVSLVTLLGNNFTVAEVFTYAAVLAAGQTGIPTSSQIQAVKDRWPDPYQAILDLAKNTGNTLVAPFGWEKTDPDWLVSNLGSYRMARAVSVAFEQSQPFYPGGKTY